MAELRECGNSACHSRVDIDNPSTVSVTYTLVPPVVGYYHSTCHDPWSDHVGYGANEDPKVIPELLAMAERVKAEDPVNSPPHYRWLPNGVEVIDITETLNFTLGNAVKYILRADHKGKPEEDIAKAIWYLNRELERRSRDNGNESK